MAVKTDFTRFLAEHFIDHNGVIGLVRKHGREAPRSEAVQKWFSRNSVPADWVFILLNTLHDEYGAPVDLQAYTQEEASENNADIFT